MPGLTGPNTVRPAIIAHPSMEGRAIARPDDAFAAGPNGGPEPSMEGRAIARPDLTGFEMCVDGVVNLQWRAGQLPGLTIAGIGAMPRRPHPSMEGRAIARPDLRILVNTYGDIMPSMEGRAIARPDSSSVPSLDSSRPTFNGGPGNCPA